jgi:hypothetical protein
MFDALPRSVELGERQQVEMLLSELQLDESMILEEFGAFWPEFTKSFKRARWRTPRRLFKQN